MCDSSMFHGLSNSLVHLLLSNNRIQSLEESTFGALQRLQTLKLDNNVIKIVNFSKLIYLTVNRQFWRSRRGVIKITVTLFDIHLLGGI